jgi:hypothetical protein
LNCLLFDFTIFFVHTDKTKYIIHFHCPLMIHGTPLHINLRTFPPLGFISSSPHPSGYLIRSCKCAWFKSCNALLKFHLNRPMGYVEMKSRWIFLIFAHFFCASFPPRGQGFPFSSDDWLLFNIAFSTALLMSAPTFHVSQNALILPSFLKVICPGWRNRVLG